MNLSEFLVGACVYLAAAVIAAPLAKRLGIGSVLGYLIAGMIIGPAVLGIVGRDTNEVMHFAEFGVILMLFLVGLELRPSKLWQLRKPILGLGGLQMLATSAGIMGVAIAMGMNWQAAFCTGLILALSSTAIVMQSLSERGQTRTATGQASFSVLLFQDISVIPILALLPFLSQGGSTQASSVNIISSLPTWAQAACVLGAVVLVIIIGRYAVPPLFRVIAKSGLHEIFIGFSLLIVVSITLLMQVVGLSPALGTFLAGVMLADSEYRHEIEADLEPFKGLLLAVFFLAVGAGIDFNLLLQHPFDMLGYLAAFILVKLAVLYLVARIFRMNRQNSTSFAFNLSQGSEFAFVLISFCVGLTLLNTQQAAWLVAIVALSMALSPLLMMGHEKLIAPRFNKKDDTRKADVIDEEAPVIIAGYGRFGMTVGRILQARGFQAVVLDQDAEQIETLKRFGYRVYYGDASRPDLLESAGAKVAKALVIAIDDRAKVTEIARTARQHFPNLRIFARAYDRIHAYELLNAGIHDVYREVFSASADMGEDVLVALGLRPFSAYRLVRSFKKHDERILRESAKHAGDDDTIMDIIKRGRTELMRILASDRISPAISEDGESWNAHERVEVAEQREIKPEP